MIRLRRVVAAPILGVGLVMTVVSFGMGFATIGVLNLANRIAGVRK